LIKPTTIRAGIHSIALIAVASMLSACEPHLTNANLAYVKPGMMTKEVESLLGMPTSVETTGSSDATPGQVRYTYEQDGRKVELTFVNDRLSPDGISGSFEK
jgi:hypothetical protein